MASILKVDTITGVATAGSIAITGEGNSTTTNLQQGLAKAFNRGESNAALVDSSNITSGTDNGTGDYTYAFTNNMNNGSYSVIATCQYANISSFDHSELTTASYNVRIFSRADSLTNDDARNCQVVMGDLA